MAEQIVFAPFGVALLTAVLALLARSRGNLQEKIAAAGFSLYLVSAVLLASRSLNSTLTYQIGGWEAPFGIGFVADALSGSMVLLAALVATTSLWHALRNEEYGQYFLPLLGFMLVGVTGAFLTGDLFNLFVWFEVTLMSSYVLISYSGGNLATRTALEYLAVNLIGSSFMLVAIGGIYSTLGTLNMADISRRLANPGAYNASADVSLAFFAILLCVFALKAGLAPFQFWVPDAYRAAPNSVSSLLSGIAKKVGIYAVLRLYLGVLSASAATYSFLGFSASALQLAGLAMVLMACGSILVGGTGALSSGRLDEILAYSSIGQAGFIFVPLGIAALTGSGKSAAVAAGIVYLFNHAAAKAMLFQLSGMLREKAGTTSIEELSGLFRESRIMAAVFFIGMLSLIGIPPTPGFFGKLGIFGAALGLPAVLAVAVTGSLLALLYFSRVWNSLVWGESDGFDEFSTDRAELAGIAVLAVLLLLMGVGFELTNRFASGAAEAALNQEAYREAVLQGGGR